MRDIGRQKVNKQVKNKTKTKTKQDNCHPLKISQLLSTEDSKIAIHLIYATENGLSLELAQLQVLSTEDNTILIN